MCGWEAFSRELMHRVQASIEQFGGFLLRKQKLGVTVEFPGAKLIHLDALTLLSIRMLEAPL